MRALLDAGVYGLDNDDVGVYLWRGHYMINTILDDCVDGQRFKILLYVIVQCDVTFHFRT